MAENKNISYLNKDFASFKQQLIDFARTYYPNTATDFSPASPGTMFIEMASYVGDVLSFYLDNQVQENFLQYARQTQNLYSLAYMLGYKPKVSSAATVDITFYQQVPATVSGSVTIPDFSYTLKYPANTRIQSKGGTSVQFLVGDEVDFSFSSSLDPTQVRVYQVNSTTGQPTKYLLSKTRKAISATVGTTTSTFGSIPEPFTTIDLSVNNFLGILDIFDSQGNEWYEVDYLAQDAVFDSIRNTNINDPNFSSDSSDTPYLLRLKQADRRFVTRLSGTNGVQLQFGSGVVANNDETIVPNPDNVGMGLPFEKDKLTTAFSPTNFIFTDSYGIAPSNTTLTIRYLTGGGVGANVQSNTITTLLTLPTFNNVNLDPATAQDIFDNIAINNLEAASGGGSGDTTEEIRQNSMAQFASQLRTVTEQDYIVRALSMPSKYGSLAKVFLTQRLASEASNSEMIASVDLYCLAFDNQRTLKTPSTALKNNLKTYLSQYRTIGDAVDIKNAYVVNIAVDFDIIVLPNYNSSEVVLQCLSTIKNFFNIDNWQINQPIILRDIYVLLDQVRGVQSVKNITITNKAGASDGYSAFGYDIEGATINGVIYPSIDPSIFEVKYPNSDIIGRVVTF